MCVSFLQGTVHRWSMKCSTLLSGSWRPHGITLITSSYALHPKALYQSINLQMWRCGSVPPFVNLLCDHGAAERAALLPVEPQSDAFVTEYVLHGRKRTRQHVLRWPYMTRSIKSAALQFIWFRKIRFYTHRKTWVIFTKSVFFFKLHFWRKKTTY